MWNPLDWVCRRCREAQQAATLSVAELEQLVDGLWADVLTPWTGDYPCCYPGDSPMERRAMLASDGGLDVNEDSRGSGGLLPA